MGGRGAHSGLSFTASGNYGGYGSLAGIIQAGQDAAKSNWNINYNPNKHGDYDDGGNPALVKYQQQEDDKTANFLAGTDRNIDLSDPQYSDGYVYHDLPLNKLLARLSVKSGPTVMNNSDFNAYLQQTGQQACWRGWSSRDSAQRFLNTTNNHVGNGVMGDGYYFSPNKSTALNFTTHYSMGNGEMMRLALSPKARVIDLGTLRQAMAQTSPRLQSALSKAGRGGSGRTFGANNGEAQFALKMGYNVIWNGNYAVAITNDALVACSNLK